MSQFTRTMPTTNDDRDATLQLPSSADDDVDALPQHQLNDDDTDNNEEKEQDENETAKKKKSLIPILTMTIQSIPQQKQQ